MAVHPPSAASSVSCAPRALPSPPSSRGRSSVVVVVPLLASTRYPPTVRNVTRSPIDCSLPPLRGEPEHPTGAAPGGRTKHGRSEERRVGKECRSRRRRPRRRRRKQYGGADEQGGSKR